MSEEAGERATTRSFEEKYTRFRAQSVRDVIGRVVGSDLANGYTTREQAERLADALGLGPQDLLLDLGAGRGWPGSLIAGRSGCRLVSADLPLEALRSHGERPAARAPGRPAAVISADGRRLPFPAFAFDGVVHTDVLC